MLPSSPYSLFQLVGSTAYCSGEWTVANLGNLGRGPLPLPTVSAEPLILDGSQLTALDTAGAWLLGQMIAAVENQGRKVTLQSWRSQHQALLALVRDQGFGETVPSLPVPGFLERLGRNTVTHLSQGYALLSFLGEASIAIGKALGNPRRLRLKALLHHLQTAGFDALPIVGLLSFLMGIVIAYQGGVQLRSYGANIFIVDLVGVTLLRELSPLLTAIIVAGRTGSAFTAQIGTMQVTDEVDALRTIGISPLDLLVVPRLLALMLALPLLTVYGDLLGMLGGLVMAVSVLDVAPSAFLDRFPDAVGAANYYIGLGKAPVFAAIIAVVGCFQGLRVGGSAEAVGRQVTVSVVQAIFLVIVADAAFSVIFSWLKL